MIDREINIAAHVATIHTILIATNVITETEYDKLFGEYKAEIERLQKEALEQFYKDNPGADLFRTILEKSGL